MLTENRNPNSARIDVLPSLDIVRVISAEDQHAARIVAEAAPAIAQAIDAVVERWPRGGRLIYIGAGTSGRLGILDAVECLPTYGVPADRVIGLIAGGEAAFVRSVEGAEDRPELGEGDLRAIGLTAADVVVGIAASGHTPYTLGAIAYADHIGAATVGISCNAPAPLLEAAQIAIALPVGPEVVTGSTRMKAGTAQKLTLNMISTGAMVRLGKVYGNLMVDVQVSNSKLVRRAQGIVREIGGVSADEAARLLDAAGGHAKTAIVMARRGVNAHEARALLDAADGFLRRVIDPAEAETP
jgi:N-acetylmuramic acid 6-phosphate etherase